MSDIEKYRREYQKKSLFELYVLKQRTHPDTLEHHVVIAMIEQKQERRDRWTLIAAIVAAGASVVALFLGH